MLGTVDGQGSLLGVDSLLAGLFEGATTRRSTPAWPLTATS